MNTWMNQGDPQQTLPCRFEPDGTYVSEVMQHTMQWRCVELPTKADAVTAETRLVDVSHALPTTTAAEDCVWHVQVEQYPPLFATRTAVGGWRMENVNAIVLER